MTYILTIVIAIGFAGDQTRTLRYGGSGGESACTTRLMTEFDRLHSRGERVLAADCSYS
jgi:hypothetical protein